MSYSYWIKLYSRYKYFKIYVIIYRHLNSSAPIKVMLLGELQEYIHFSATMITNEKMIPTHCNYKLDQEMEV